MIKFHLKIQNNMITTNLLYIITGIVIIFNVLIRIFPTTFIDVSFIDSYNSFFRTIIPINLFTYCDVYLLLLFIVIILFSIGTDFGNSMEDISLAIGGSNTNKFMVRKLISLLVLYIIFHMISFINIYSLYIKLIGHKASLIPFTEIILCSFSTNIFIISLSLLILFLVRDITVSITIIASYYLIEESLWRCKIFKEYGVLGHLYQYYDYENGEMIKFKLIYILIAIVLLIITYKISKRKFSGKAHFIFRGHK
ncbi:MAG: hypothetical protein RR636_11060 [Clostridium sp.]|uniref:hypothetical protein n=2 Tax=Clostridium sp. TaxID=1506 RepID=UPI00304C22B2